MNEQDFVEQVRQIAAELKGAQSALGTVYNSYAQVFHQYADAMRSLQSEAQGSPHVTQYDQQYLEAAINELDRANEDQFGGDLSGYCTRFEKTGDIMDEIVQQHQ